ncbi:MAG: hypothetical protein ACK51L_04050, partial [bacterium]
MVRQAKPSCAPVISITLKTIGTIAKLIRARPSWAIANPLKSKPIQVKPSLAQPKPKNQLSSQNLPNNYRNPSQAKPSKA